MRPILILAGAIVALFLFAMFAYTPAHAHDAPSGWSYGWECCHALDCDQVDNDTTIHATEAGWLIDETGETIPYADKRIKKSGDEHFHRCRMTSTDPHSKTRCLYVPPQGS